MQPGSEATIPSYFECISVMFPVTFPVTFHFGPHNLDTLVGSRSVPQSDRSKISDCPRFVSRVRSQGFRGQSRSVQGSKPALTRPGSITASNIFHCMIIIRNTKNLRIRGSTVVRARFDVPSAVRPKSVTFQFPVQE